MGTNREIDPRGYKLDFRSANVTGFERDDPRAYWNVFAEFLS
jgi:hypothetical protein